MKSINRGERRRFFAGAGRRGMIAACVAAAAALSERVLDQKTAMAADGQALFIGLGNSGTGQTSLGRGAGATGTAFIVGDASTGDGAILGAITGAPPKSGVKGVNTAGYGLHGITDTGAAVFADAISTGIGFQGRSGTGTGVVGSTNGTVILSQNQAPLAAFAAQFFGGHGVFIDGDLQVTGQKSAVVPHTDGSLVRVFCMEAPESYFEDFGEGTLQGGAAAVSLDNDFGPLVKKNRYHVFLTPYGDSKGLYVTNRTPRGFEVHEQGGGKTNGLRFAYRIVAPRADSPEQRLPKSTRQKLPNPKAPTIEDVRRQVNNLGR